MNDISKPLLRAFSKEKSRAPFWFMRQAGRYLPEYRELRCKAKNFLDFCYTPEMAAEATLQPIRRFGMDGAIIFSDILVVPHMLGADVKFEEGHGPILVPVQNEKELLALKNDEKKLLPVYAALKLTKSSLSSETGLIGFAGAPWTLACYMVEGKGSRDFQKVRSLALRDKVFFEKLISILSKAVADHLKEQIKAGADVVQIFDSWAGVLSENEFSKWVIEPTKTIVADVKKSFPHIPIIGFPRQAGTKYRDYAIKTGVDAVSVDSSVSLEWVKNELQPICIVQGNLDPVVLAEDKNAMLKEAGEIISTLGDNAFVFNLGHGILPHTPIENVEALCQLLRKT